MFINAAITRQTKTHNDYTQEFWEKNSVFERSHKLKETSGGNITKNKNYIEMKTIRVFSRQTSLTDWILNGKITNIVYKQCLFDQTLNIFWANQGIKFLAMSTPVPKILILSFILIPGKLILHPSFWIWPLRLSIMIRQGKLMTAKLQPSMINLSISF